MKIEKQIRAQARYSLKGNWVTAVSTLTLRMARIMLCYMFFFGVMSVFSLYDFDKDRFKPGLGMIITIAITFILYFMLSPIKNGCYRIYSGIAEDGSSDFGEAFYFFSGINLYITALAFNLIIALKRLIYIIIALIPAFMLKALALIFQPVFFSDIGKAETVDIITGILITLGVIFGFLFSLRLYANDFLFAAADEPDITVVNRRARVITKHRTRDFILLCFSFVGWILLTIATILPIFYTLPYIGVAFTTSVKWLNRLKQNG